MAEAEVVMSDVVAAMAACPPEPVLAPPALLAEFEPESAAAQPATY
jgi:hypothetical protein